MKAYLISVSAMMASFLFLAATVAIATDCMTGMAGPLSDSAVFSSRCGNITTCF